MTYASIARTMSLGLPILWAAALAGQTGDRAAYTNPDLPAEKRAADLVSRMSLEEKVLQM